MSVLFQIGFIFSLIFSPSTEFVEMHDFHISKSILKYKEKEQAIQVSMHLFLDDFEEALEAKGADSLFLCTKMEHPKADEYIQRYLEDRFEVIVDDRVITFNFIGKEISEDLAGVWIYLEATNIEDPKICSLRNKLLTEVFNDQKNIVSVSAYGQEKFIDFGYDDDLKSIKWK